MDATIVIPVKNGGKLLSKVLDRVFTQKTEYEYEVVCVDSGSTDDSINIMKKYPCKLFEIKPEEFGHGKTRNYGASKGVGEYILFLTQDALPADDCWLQNFIDGMKSDKEIVGGFGKHIPYPDCNEIDKRDLKLHFEGFGAQNTVYKLSTASDIERYRDDEGFRHFMAFYSDNNSCMRRDIWEKYPYDDVDFAEDQIWARKMIEHGYKKLYCANAVVYHSHNYPLETYYNRYYDEYKSLYNLHGYVMFKNKNEVKPQIEAMNTRDFAYIDDVANGIKDKEFWKKYAAKRNEYRCNAAYVAGLYHKMPESVQTYLDRHKSQQYKQIAKNKKQKYDKALLKWFLIEPDLAWGEREDKPYKLPPDLLECLEKKDRQKCQNDVCAYYDFIMKQPEVPFDKEAYQKAKSGRIIINWVIPEMGVGSGGHIDIFRFVKFLNEMGFKNKIYLMKKEIFKTDEQARAFVAEYYGMDNEDIEFHVDIEDMGFAHATFATAWNTAYKVRDFNNTISKFYFVQDFEPLFFPVGSEYVFAENTYKFGFRGITAGNWLRDKLHDEYGMQTSSFLFSYDHDLYHPGSKRDKTKRVFFYARPVTPRRDFELGLLALNKLTSRMPDVEVVFAGWDVSSYRIDFKHGNFGSVKLTELSDLYAQCDLCLVLSGTNLSLLPLEAMASNSAVVCTKGANSTWLVNDKNAIMVDFDADDIADKLEYYLTHEEELAAIRKKGLDFALNTSSWENEAVKVAEAIKKGIEEDEKNISSRW